MDQYREIAERIGADRISEIIDTDHDSHYKDNSKVRIYGIISKIEKRTTKNNSTMCFVTIEDMTASIECIIFARQYAERVQHLQMGNIILIGGRVSMREDKDVTIVCETIEPNPKNILKDDVKPEKKKRKGIFARISSRNCDEMKKIFTLTEIFEGAFPLYAYYIDENKYELISNVSLNEPLLNELRYILGDENLVVRS